MPVQTIGDVQKRSVEGHFHVKNNMPSKTNREHADAANIHKIIECFNVNGTVPNVNQNNPIVNTDFSDMPDLRTALDRVLEARRAFLKLPEEVRTRFDNNPMEMAEFLKDEKNQKEAIKLGLLVEEIDEDVEFGSVMAQAVSEGYKKARRDMDKDAANKKT